MYSFRYTIGIIVGVCLDIFSKNMASAQLSFWTPKIIIKNILSLQLVHNYGAAYGILQKQTYFLIGVSIIVLIGGYLLRHQIGKTIYSRIGLCFLFIGATGNLIDRIRFGYVVDFINIHIIPVFNIADICINLCLLCFILEIITAHYAKPK